MSALERLAALDAPARLAARDVTLFSDDPAVQREVANNLGWTALARESAEVRTLVDAVAAEMLSDTPDDVVLLGMGGSSLASLVVASTLGGASGPRMRVLDTTSPVTVKHVLDAVYPAKTIFVVASKSGSTIEPMSLYRVFRDAADDALGRAEAGARFIAITDPGSPLEAFAAEEGFRAIVPAPATVGGRYSALTTFGLVPAALAGIDLDVPLERAARMERACELPAENNPAALLAAFALDAHDAGRDKLTIVASPAFSTLGLWIEQLVAESLGKEGTGILPVVELSDDKPFGYGPDRAIVVVRTEDDDRLEGWAAEFAATHPVHEIVARDERDLAAEFVRWEHAVALMGPLLGVNPFGQPNVAAAKAATTAVLDGTLRAPSVASITAAERAGVTFAGTLEAPKHFEASLGTAIGHAVAALRDGDFLGLLAYLPDDPELLEPLVEVVPPVAAGLGAAVTLELGPRYLHSTGQYHKGGRDNGVYVLVTTADERDVEVPGRPWGLRTLHRAQASGDLVTLSEAGRRVLWIELPDASAESVAELVRGLADAAGIVTEER